MINLEFLCHNLGSIHSSEHTIIMYAALGPIAGMINIGLLYFPNIKPTLFNPYNAEISLYIL